MPAAGAASTSTTVSSSPPVARTTGTAATYSLSEFTARVTELASASDTVFVSRDGLDPYAPPGVPAPLSPRRQLEEALRQRLPGKIFRDAAPLIARMRLIKDAYEIAALRRKGIA